MDGKPARTPSSKRKRRKQRGPIAPPARAARILDDLRALARDLAREAGAQNLDELPIDAISMALEVALRRPPQEQREVQAAAVVNALRARLKEALKGAAAFRQGHVYDFYSDAAESPHSSPPRGADVFAGYAPNGKPAWVSFANLCLARGEARVDRLYADPPEVIALVQLGDELTDGLLPSFGRDSLAYSVLGQVAVGLLPQTLEMASRDADRVALTLQIVETTQGTANQRLRLNVLGMTPEALIDAAAQGDAKSPAEGFRRVLRATRNRIDAVGRQRRRRAIAEDPAAIAQLLGRLRGDVLRVFKHRGYRTQHAAERHKSGERPTGSAIHDARQAGEGRFFVDTKRETIVILGKRGRAHIFTETGRHVTSLQLDRGEVERKTDRARWKPLSRARMEAFRERLDAAAARE